jgi:hypothetical protein
MLCNSWIITRTSDGRAIFETYSAAVAAKVNRDAYTVETAWEYLARINRTIREQGAAHV